MMPLTAKKRAANQVQGTPILSVMARLADEAQVRHWRRRRWLSSSGAGGAGRQAASSNIPLPELIALLYCRHNCAALQEVDNLEQELARGVAQAAASRKRQRSGGIKDDDGDDGDDGSLMGGEDDDDKEGGKWKDEEEGGDAGDGGIDGKGQQGLASKGKKPLGRAQRTAMLEQAVEAG